MKKGENMDKVKQEVIAEKKVKAPIKKGDALGTLVIKRSRCFIKQTIVAKEDVAAASWWELFKRSFGMFSTSK